MYASVSSVISIMMIAVLTKYNLNLKTFLSNSHIYSLSIRTYLKGGQQWIDRPWGQSV